MTDEIECPKTPEEAEKLLREWHEKGETPDCPEDVLAQFEADTCVARYLIQLERRSLGWGDAAEAIGRAAITMADASETLLREMARWEVYEKAVELVGGSDQAFEIRIGHRPVEAKVTA